MMQAAGAILTLRPIDVPGLTLAPGVRAALIAEGWMPPRPPAPEPAAHPEDLGEVCGLCPECAGPDDYYAQPCGAVHDCSLCALKRALRS